MFSKRLINMVGKSRKYIFLSVFTQWISLLANVVLMYKITQILEAAFKSSVSEKQIITVIVTAAAVILIRAACNILNSKMNYLSSKSVKLILREKIYSKLLRIGTGYKEKVNTSEVVQVTVEGVEQLETYFGAYLPQFFYAMAATLTLFGVLAFIHFPTAVVLLICVPLIPVSIALVQKWAKKLLAKYWGKYASLGNSFLENLQGLTTLKIYQSDAFKNKEMNEEAEEFRKITMKVLTMQLNSITIMDLIAYGGAAAGIIMAVTGYASADISLAGCLFIILISADYFIPMRLMGSFFHVAMNGMAASDKIFKLLDLEEENQKDKPDLPDNLDITCNNLSYSYDKEKQVLSKVHLSFPKGSYSALVGASGCGKSTIAGVLTGKNRLYTGEVLIGGTELRKIKETELLKTITYIGHNSFLFKGTVAENLRMAKPEASDEELWTVLQRTNMAEFLKSENGLDTMITASAGNISGGQRQRLALARALLHDSPLYIFDEATSNIDVESETTIMNEIKALIGKKTVIVISHRLANIVDADTIYVMKNGEVVERGKHQNLIHNQSVYSDLWKTQQDLENYVERSKAC